MKNGDMKEKMKRSLKNINKLRERSRKNPSYYLIKNAPKSNELLVKRAQISTFKVDARSKFDDFLVTLDVDDSITFDKGIRGARIMRRGKKNVK